MKITAAVSRADEAIPRLESLELGEPRAREVRVRIVATGICHTDLAFHGPFGANFASKPIVLGHEGAGVVEAVGAGVDELEVGDPVVLSGNSCGVCPSCRSGRPVYCDDMIRLCWSGGRLDGSSPLSQSGTRVSGMFFGQSSFATQVIAPVRTAVKVPGDAPLKLLGPLGCGMITGAGSVLEALRVRPGQSIVVFGAGGVGMAALMAARIAGAARIVAVDIDDGRLELARALGATDAVRSGDRMAETLRALQPRGFDFSFVTAPHLSVLDAAIGCLATEGTAGFVASPQEAWSPNLFDLLSGGRKLQGIIGGNANPQTFIPLMIDYWRKGLFPFDRLVTEFAFENLDQAWEQFRTGKVIKPVLLMP